MHAAKVYRSAVTGEFVTEEYAKLNPSTTVCETFEVDEGHGEVRPIKLVLWGPLTGYVK